MYSGSGFSDWEIGDITVVLHKGTYHLFHLIIPNHDYIAHAVSNDGISWKRVKNALFVGHPGEWDDDMLWTMHVCEVQGKFEMYYTGLHRKDRGVVSRIGFAESKDLIDWTKNTKQIFPIGPKGIFYETATSNPRTWLSFRDPFRFEYEGEVYLLLGARTINGPVSRRGCVGLIKITRDIVTLLPPLFFPRVYDDVECPCIFQLKNRFYLIGSIREDIKVRYWYSDEFFGPYRVFHADVLLPQGNYAARIVQDGEHLLIYNFFYAYGKIDALRVLPPPKELEADETGKLILKSYYRWDQIVRSSIRQNAFGEFKYVFSNATALAELKDGRLLFSSTSGYEILYFTKPSASFIWEGTLNFEGIGTFGLVSDIDGDGNGYYYSFNVRNGQVLIRVWGFNPINNRQNFIYSDLQSEFFQTKAPSSLRFRLVRYGHYIELSIDSEVKLTLIDYTYSGNGLGLYCCSAMIELTDSIFKLLPDPAGEYASQEEAQKIE